MIPATLRAAETTGTSSPATSAAEPDRPYFGSTCSRTNDGTVISAALDRGVKE
jgi:hypothetical protein